MAGFNVLRFCGKHIGEGFDNLGVAEIVIIREVSLGICIWRVETESE